MADNELTVLTAAGATKTLRDRDIEASGIHAQKIDVAPWRPAVVGGAQYSVDVTSSAVVTLTVPSGATHVLLSIDGGDVRFTEDTSNPSAGSTGNGLILKDGFIGELNLPNALRLIAVSTTAQLNATYRKYI